jgi:DNA-binding transcriptional MerR regulator
MAAPKRDLFKAGEVCEMAQLQPYVLRSWESEFPHLGRLAENGSARIYRRGDVELVLRIKQLVFGEGLTLAGARRRLEEEDKDPQTTSVAALAVEDALGDLARSRLRQIRSGLEAIMAMLARDSPRDEPELKLVPPGDRPSVTRRKPAAARAGGKARSKGGKRRRASA